LENKIKYKATNNGDCRNRLKHGKGEEDKGVREKKEGWEG